MLTQILLCAVPRGIGDIQSKEIIKTVQSRRAVSITELKSGNAAATLSTLQWTLYSVRQ